MKKQLYGVEFRNGEPFEGKLDKNFFIKLNFNSLDKQTINKQWILAWSTGRWLSNIERIINLFCQFHLLFWYFSNDYRHFDRNCRTSREIMAIVWSQTKIIHLDNLLVGRPWRWNRWLEWQIESFAVGWCTFSTKDTFACVAQWQLGHSKDT